MGIYVVIGFFKRIVLLRIAILLIALLLLISRLVLRQILEVQRRNLDIVDILEARSLKDVRVEGHVLVAVIGVEAELIRVILGWPSLNFILALLVWTLSGLLLVCIGLTHYFFETISLNEFDAVIFIDLIDRNTLVLQGEEEVNEFAYLVGVVGFLFLQLLHFSLLFLQLDEQV